MRSRLFSTQASHQAVAFRVTPRQISRNITRRMWPHGLPFMASFFLPLVTSELKLTCWLDILYLRRKKPGELFEHGDIDNRLKTLIDSLAMPDLNQSYASRTQGTDELPYFYCLLENDRLVSKVTVETDYLLEDLPITDDHKKQDENDENAW